jgi:prophage antirepressor-like protein
MTQLQNTLDFYFQEKTVRTLTMQDGSFWFVAKDVCDVLDIAWFGHKTLASIPESWKGVGKLPTPSSEDNRGGGEQQLILITEPAVYKLAFRSNKPAADDFTNWVASEVLPAIRKTGRYGAAAPAPLPHGHDDQILLARLLVREVNGMLANLSTLGQLHQNMVVSVNNVLRTVCVLNPEVHHEAFVQSLRSQGGGK